MTRQKEISQEVSNRPRLPPTSGDVPPAPRRTEDGAPYEARYGYVVT